MTGLGQSLWDSHSLIHPPIGTILCAERWCCLSSLLVWWWEEKHGITFLGRIVVVCVSGWCSVLDHKLKFWGFLWMNHTPNLVLDPQNHLPMTSNYKVLVLLVFSWCSQIDGGQLEVWVFLVGLLGTLLCGVRSTSKQLSWIKNLLS